MATGDSFEGGGGSYGFFSIFENFQNKILLCSFMHVIDYFFEND